MMASDVVSLPITPNKDPQKPFTTGNGLTLMQLVMIIVRATFEISPNKYKT